MPSLFRCTKESEITLKGRRNDVRLFERGFPCGHAFMMVLRIPVLGYVPATYPSIIYRVDEKPAFLTDLVIREGVIPAEKFEEGISDCST